MAANTYSLAKDGQKKITPNFKIAEFACKDGSDTILIETRLLNVLEKIRTGAGNKPISITSGYRTASYNKKIGGATNSFHMKGYAADIQIGGQTPTQVSALAEKALGDSGIIGGIGLYATFTHVDVRDSKWRQNMVTGQNVSGFGPSSYQTIREGDRGESVKLLQSKLKITSDGIFGPATKKAVMDFQRLKGLTPIDGICGPITWNAILK
jgi:peptidoglycan hydrolase-like protein with peptidoglycan-binding domain